MGDLKVGDVIYGPDGKPTNITYITDTMHDRKCYKVEMVNGEIITADAEHLWTWYDPSYSDIITENTEFLIKRLEAYKTSTNQPSIFKTKCLEFEKKEVPIDPYLAGVWLTGKWRAPTSNQLQCYIDHSEKIIELLDEAGIIHDPFHFTRAIIPRLGRIRIPGLNSIFKAVKFNAKTRRIPSNYIFTDVESRLKLVQGIFDRRGHAYVSGRVTLKILA